MHPEDEFIDLFNQKNRRDPVELSDAELALALQTGRAQAPGILDALVARYAPDVFRLAWIVQSDYGKRAPQTGVINRIVERVFLDAVGEISQYSEQEGFRHWLAGLTLRTSQHTGRSKAFSIQADLESEISLYPTDKYNAIGEPFRDLLHVFDLLTSQQRLVLVLSHLFAFSPEELARLLDLRVDRVIDQANNAHQDLLPFLPQSLGIAAGQIEEILKAVFQGCWPAPVLSKPVIDRLVRSVNSHLARKGRMNFRRIIRTGAWSTATVLLLAGLFWLLNRSELRLTNKPAGTSTPAIDLPAPLQAEVGSGAEVSQDTIRSLPEFNFSIEPSFSSDGRYIVFTSSDQSLVAGDTNDAMDIFVYDRQSGEIERVNLTSSGEQAEGWSYSPSISADGRWVAFESTATNLDPQGGLVEGEGVFLHDRISGKTQRVDAAPDGISRNQHGFMPIISADGQTILYWSRIMSSSCPGNPPDPACLDLYFFDRMNQTTGNIPIERRWDQLLWDRRLGISADGRRIALTIFPGDGIAKQLGVGESSAVFVYDRLKGEFSLASVSSTGDPGNGESYAPNISADGQVVAFVSRAANLVPDDTNGSSDIFVHDFRTGNTERVSVGAGGAQADRESGVSQPGNSYWRDNVGISADGDSVAFVSASLNLDGSSVNCLPASEAGCNAVYLYDRRSGITRRLTRPDPNWSYLFAAVSGDGQFTAYVQLHAGCFPLSLDLICSDILFYDRSTQVETALSRGIPAQAGAGWQLKTQLTGQSDMVNSLAFSPDGQLLATGSDDGRIVLWQLPGGENTTTLERAADQGAPSAITSLAFSPDGDLLAAGLYNGKVDIWRVSNGSYLFSLPEHPGKVIAVAFASQGKQLVVGTPQSVWVWSADQDIYEPALQVDYPAGFITGMAVVPGGEYLALATNDKTVWIQRLDSKSVILRLGGHAEKVMSVAVSPDGRYLASGSIDGSINLWQIEEKDSELNADYLGTVWHANWVRSLTISPDEKLLASGSLYDGLDLWSLPDGKLVDAPLAGRSDQINAMAFSPDGGTLAASSNAGGVYIWGK